MSCWVETWTLSIFPAVGKIAEAISFDGIFYSLFVSAGFHAGFLVWWGKKQRAERAGKFLVDHTHLLLTTPILIDYLTKECPTQVNQLYQCTFTLSAFTAGVPCDLKNGYQKVLSQEESS